MTVLIVAPPDDVHSNVVAACLERRAVRVARLDTGAVLASSLHATISNGERLRARLGDLDLDDVRAIWLRRYGMIRASVDPQAAPFVVREAQSFLLTIAAALKDRRWVNPVGAAFATDGGSGKLSQLEVARACGLDVPETLATNSPDEARAFVEAHPEGAIYKPFESPHLEDKRVIFTRRILATDDLSGVARAPCIFQALVPKRCDLRGLVVGDRVWCAEIHSQAHPDSEIDFRRRYALGEIRYAAHALPAAVEARVLEWHARLGLVLGAFDLIHTPDGRYVALESNQAGAFLWLQQQLPELRLVEAVADLLAGR